MGKMKKEMKIFSSDKEKKQILACFFDKRRNLPKNRISCGIKVTVVPPNLSTPGLSLFVIEEIVNQKKWLCSFFFPTNFDEDGTVVIRSFDELGGIKYQKSEIKNFFGI